MEKIRKNYYLYQDTVKKIARIMKKFKRRFPTAGSVVTEGVDLLYVEVMG